MHTFYDNAAHAKKKKKKKKKKEQNAHVSLKKEETIQDANAAHVHAHI